jgi:hypothetical protein
VVVDKEGTIVVADMRNQRLRKIVGRQVTTLAGGSEAGTADGAGPGARFQDPCRLAMDERGCLFVAEAGLADMLRVVDASLALPAWMGPVDAAAEAHEEKAQQMVQLVGDYGKLVEDGELADGVFGGGGALSDAPQRAGGAERVLSGSLQVGDAGRGLQGGVLYEDMSASAFRVLLRFIYAGELPAWEVRDKVNRIEASWKLKRNLCVKETEIEPMGQKMAEDEAMLRIDGQRVVGARARAARAKSVLGAGARAARAKGAKRARAARGAGRPMRKRKRRRGRA